jgi:hypothetical protein
MPLERLSENWALIMTEPPEDLAGNSWYYQR